MSRTETRKAPSLCARRLPPTWNLNAVPNAPRPDHGVLSSTRQALFLCAQLLVDVGKPILLKPGYYGAKKAFETAETKVVPIDVDALGIRTDLLYADRSGANCVYITPSHQYPTGATLPLERRLELINWAERGKWVIEDDYDSEFHYDGQPTACVQGLDKYQRTPLHRHLQQVTLYPAANGLHSTAPRVDQSSHLRAQHHGRPHATNPATTLARFMEDAITTPMSGPCANCMPGAVPSCSTRYPRYQRAQIERVHSELYPKVRCNWQNWPSITILV